MVAALWLGGIERVDLVTATSPRLGVDAPASALFRAEALRQIGPSTETGAAAYVYRIIPGVRPEIPGVVRVSDSTRRAAPIACAHAAEPTRTRRGS